MRIMVVGNPGGGIGAYLVDQLIQIGHHASFGTGYGCQVLWEKADLIIIAACNCCTGELFQSLDALANNEKVTKGKIFFYSSSESTSIRYYKGMAKVHGKVHMVAHLTDEDVFEKWSDSRELESIIEKLQKRKTA